MKGDNLWNGGTATGCADQAYGWSGGGNGYKTEVWVNGDGSRVAVLLLNARHWATAQPSADQAAHHALWTPLLRRVIAAGLQQRMKATVSPRKAARRARTAARRAGTAPLVSAATRGTRRAAATRCRR